MNELQIAQDQSQLVALRQINAELTKRLEQCEQIIASCERCKGLLEK